MLQALVMQAAAQLASAIMSRVQINLTPDPEINGQVVKELNVMAFRLTHIYYDGLLKALNPKTGWQVPPDLGPAGAVPLVPGADLAKLLSDLVGAIPRPPAVAGPAAALQALAP